MYSGQNESAVFPATAQSKTDFQSQHRKRKSDLTPGVPNEVPRSPPPEKKKNLYALLFYDI